MKNINIILTITLLLLISLSTSIDAQDYVVNLKHWSIEDGLSHRQVNTIFQDKDGLIWIGTKNGLNSFDGYEFKHWLGRQGNVDARNIHRIGQDDEGWLWLQRQDNLIFYHPKTNEFKTIVERFGKTCPLLEFSASHFVNDFGIDNFGRIYYEKYNSNILYTYHSLEGFIKINLPLKLEHAYSKIQLSDDRLTLILIYGGTGKIILNRKSLSDSFDFKTIAFFDKNYQLVPISYEALIQKVNNQSSYFKVCLNPKKTRWITEFDDTNSFIVYNNQNEQIATISTDDFPELKNGYFGKYIFDRNDKFWLASAFGFYRIDLTKQYVDFLASPKNNNNTLPVRGIHFFENELIAAFEPGFVYTYDAIQSQWKFKQKGNWLKSFHVKSNTLWIGSNEQLIHVNNNEVTDIDLYKFNKHDFYDIWSIQSSLSDNNVLWLGTQRGLAKFNKSTQKSEPYKRTNDLIGFKDFHIQTIIPDKNDKKRLWLCTSKGLILMDENKGFLKVYNQDNNEESFLPATNFQHLHQDKNGVFWLATADNGLIKWNAKTNEYQVFSLKDGFANDVIYAVYQDDFDNLWMSSDFGIIKINKSSFNVENYGLEQGIGQTEFNRISHFQSKEGIIYFGGLKGVTRFHPKDFQQNINKNKSWLILSNFEQFEGNSRTIINKTVETKNNLTITLRPSDYIYNLDFSVLSYDNSDKNQYIFQFLKDGEPSDDWQTQKNRSIQLGQLPYGNHQLIVKGKDVFGNDCENSITLTIGVLRPFYLQFWFLSLLFCLAIVVIYFYNKWHTQNLLQQQKRLQVAVEKATTQIRQDKQTIETQAEELKQLDKLKSTFFANVSHELRTPLTLMLAPIKSVIKRADLDNRSFTFLKTAEQNGHRLLKLVNEILDLNKLEARKLEIHQTTVAFYPFIKRVASYFTSYSEDTGVHFYFNYQLAKDIHLELDTKKVETIVNNLLSNAFKFTPKGGRIDIDIHENNQCIEIIVKDTGNGIHPNDLPNIFNRFYQSKENSVAEGGTGIGLALSKELAKLIGGDLTVESTLGKGSAFILSFPYREVLKTISDADYFASEAKLEFSAPVENASIVSKTKSTILVVEDNSSLQNYLKIILEEKYNVLIAGNGQVALKKLQELTSVSLIISDIMMPIMDGYQLLETLKNEDKYRHIPTIMLTARAAKVDKLNALRIGVDDYILKPFDEDELLIRIDNLLENAQLRQVEIAEKNEPLEQTITLSKSNMEWLKNLEQVVSLNIKNRNLTTEFLANELAISRRQLTRKVKQLTGLTPNKYITSVRLQAARELLLNERNITVKEVSYQVGFLKTEYFSKLFVAEFGKKPSEI